MPQTRAQYFEPHYYIDDFSLLRHDWVELNRNLSIPDPEINIVFSPMSLGMFRLMRQLEVGVEQVQTTYGLTVKDIEDVKAMFVSSSVYLLLLTYVISFLHIFFEFLAFKSDVGFWKGRNDFSGLSKRTIVINFFFDIIILLSLWDNDTSNIVLGSQALSVALSVWKLSKILSWRRYAFFIYYPYIITGTSKAEKETEGFDAKAVSYLAKVCYPLVFLVAVYSLLYIPHRSWFSWIVSSSANAIYMFGFIQMTPQLFVNYKTKSVAHLPWKVFMYKAFNTFIDDVFSFIIVMPMAHRVACLRDDVIFLILIYQWRLYPVDKKRVNEYGYSYAESDLLNERSGEKDQLVIDQSNKKQD